MPGQIRQSLFHFLRKGITATGADRAVPAVVTDWVPVALVELQGGVAIFSFSGMLIYK